MKSKIVNLVEAENRMVVVRGWGLVEGGKLLAQSFSYTRLISSGNLTYNNVTKINHTRYLDIAKSRS